MPELCLDGARVLFCPVFDIRRQRVEALLRAGQVQLVLVLEIMVDDPFGQVVARADRIQRRAVVAPARKFVRRRVATFFSSRFIRCIPLGK